MFIVSGIHIISLSPSGAASPRLAQRMSPLRGLWKWTLIPHAINMSPPWGLPSGADRTSPDRCSPSIKAPATAARTWWSGSPSRNRCLGDCRSEVLILTVESSPGEGTRPTGW